MRYWCWSQKPEGLLLHPTDRIPVAVTGAMATAALSPGGSPAVPGSLTYTLNEPARVSVTVVEATGQTINPLLTD